jgi:hypothetical protein
MKPVTQFCSGIYATFTVYHTVGSLMHYFVEFGGCVYLTAVSRIN